MNKNTLYRIFVVSLILLVSLSPLTILDVRAQEENTWTSLAPMQVDREGLGVATVNGKIYAIGGNQFLGSYLDTNEEYNPQTNTWTTKTPMPTPMSYFGITAYQNKIYCIDSMSGSTEVYDPATDTWESKTPLPEPRLAIRANVIDNKIYVVGGSAKTLNVYDIQNDNWIRKASMSTGPSMVGGTWSCTSAVIDDKLHVIGIDFHNIYDPELNTWTSGERLSEGHFYTVAGVTTGIDAPKGIFTIGISTNYWSLVLPDFKTQSYDSTVDSWNERSSIPTGRINAGVVALDDRIYVIGGSTLGIGSSQGSSAVAEMYTPYLFSNPPVISIASPVNMIYTQTIIIPLEFTVNEPTSWIGYSLGGQPNVTFTENTNLTIYDEGLHTLEVFARDMAGDEGSSIVTFTVDVNPPVIFVLSPKNKTYGDSNILLNVEFEEPISDMKYSLDGYENVTFTEDITLSELEVGKHNITIYATDLAGHTGVSDIIYFSVEPFPTTQVLATAAIVVSIGIGLFTYFKKYKR